MNKTPQNQFLQDIQTIGKDYADISLSDYRLKEVKKLKLSPLRTVKGRSLSLYPGRGSGFIYIGGLEFEVTYAWGGRNKEPFTWDGRISYTTRIKGEVEKLGEIINQIILFEEGSLTYEVGTREYYARFGIKGIDDYVADLEKTRIDVELLKLDNLNAKLKKLYTPRHIKVMIRNFTENWDNDSPVVLHNTMKRINTDFMSPANPYGLWPIPKSD